MGNMKVVRIRDYSGTEVLRFEVVVLDMEELCGTIDRDRQAQRTAQSFLHDLVKK